MSKQSKPSDGIAHLKERIYQKIDHFLGDPHYLPSLKYAHYQQIPKGSIYHCKMYRSKRGLRILKDMSRTTHQRHLMHFQHRENCVSVLKFLVLRMDVETHECKLVANRRGIARALYIDDIVNATGIKRRTVQSCLESITVAGYIVRTQDSGVNYKKVKRHKLENGNLRHRIFVTPKFIEDVESNVALNILQRKLSGTQKKKIIDAKKVRSVNFSRNDSAKQKSYTAAHEVFDAKPAKEYKKTSAIEAGHAAFMKSIAVKNVLKPPD